MYFDNFTNEPAYENTSYNNSTSMNSFDEIKPYLVSAIILDGLAISTNIIQMALLLRKWRHLDRTEHLLLSLCISDLTCGITMFGQDTYYLRSFLSDGNIVTTVLIAQVFECLFTFFILVSNFHVVALAIERLVAVAFPMKYHVFTTLKCKTFTICYVWTKAVLLAPTITIIMTYESDNTDQNKGSQKILGGVLLTACIVVFTIYMALVVALWRREVQMREMIPEELHRQMRDRKTTVICLLFGVAFLVCTLPLTLALLDKRLTHRIVNLLVTLNPVLNPIIYFFKMYAERKRTMSALSQSRLLPRERTFLTEGNGVTPH